MNRSSVGQTTANTFVVRIWHERAGAQSRWRGRVEHVQSGEGVAFTSFQRMVDFLGRFVEMAPDGEENAPIHSEGRRS